MPTNLSDCHRDGMKLDETILKLLREHGGRDVTTPAGAEFLRNDIEARTGEALSINTVKRLVGLLKYDSEPRLTTLDILAKYMGYSDWKSLHTALGGRVSGFNLPSEIMDLTTLPYGTTLLLKWDPGREIKIRHQGEGKYLVEDCKKSKLVTGDILCLSQIAVNFPFIVKEVIRKGESLGNYRAGSLMGLTSIEILGEDDLKPGG